MLRRFADKEALSRAAAELFAEQAQAAVADHGRFVVLLAGGDTPRRTYERLAGEPLRSRIPWGQVHFFWGDERCLPAGDPERNESMARAALLDCCAAASGAGAPHSLRSVARAGGGSLCGRTAGFFRHQAPLL